MGGEALTSRLGRKAVRMIQTAGSARRAMTVKASQLAPMSRQWMRRRVVGRGAGRLDWRGLGLRGARHPMSLRSCIIWRKR